MGEQSWEGNACADEKGQGDRGEVGRQEREGGRGQIW